MDSSLLVYTDYSVLFLIFSTSGWAVKFPRPNGRFVHYIFMILANASFASRRGIGAHLVKATFDILQISPRSSYGRFLQPGLIGIAIMWSIGSRSGIQAKNSSAFPITS